MSKMVDDLVSKGFVCNEYNGSHQKAKWTCPSGHSFEKRATFVIRTIQAGGSGCPVCFDIKNRNTKSGSNSNQHTAKDLAIETIKTIGYKLLSEYTNSKLKLKLICNNNHECEMSWENIRNGTRCVHCKFEKQSKIARKGTYEQIREIAIEQGLILLTPFDEYEGKHTRLQFIRKNESVFDTCNANIIINKYRIDGDKYRNPNKLTIEEIKKRIEFGKLELLSTEYKNNNTLLKFKCLENGHEFTDTIKSFNYKCPICNIPSTERKWLNFFEERNIKYVIHYKLHGKEIDIFLPDYNIAIECCGLYYHSINNNLLYEKIIRKEQHFEKRKLCEENSLRLFTIYDNENDSPIWESVIGNALNLSRRIFARKCKIKKVEAKEAKDFLVKNHLMGYSTAKSIGLYYEDKLVTLFTYKKCKENGLEVARFCNLIGHNVIGGYSKLLKFAEEESKPNYVLSFVDLRYGNGSSLLKTGFEIKGTTLGWKWTDFHQTYNRLACRANMDERRLSEKEHAAELGWYKIYDAGQAKFIKQLI